MKTGFYLIAGLAVILLSALAIPQKKDYKKEIVDTEKAFERMAAEKGIAEAFYHFAAEDAVIKYREDSLLVGRDAIRNHFKSKDLKNTKVTWAPDHVTVSKDGDLAYTYGKYQWTTVTDDSAKIDRGYFHTVWKRQKDGKWKFVWD